MPMVLAVLVVLIVGFVPYISPRSLRGALPTELPPLVIDPLTSATEHQRAPRRPAPPYLNEALDRLGESTLRRDQGQIIAASRMFADAVIQAGGDDTVVRDGLRETQLDRFLAHAQQGQRDPLLLVARRHELLGQNSHDTAISPAELAVLRAWFSFRWEAAGARSILQSEQAPLDQLVGRLKAPDRRALLGWVFSASCESLMGLPQDTVLTRPMVERCTNARRDFLALAEQVDRSYPSAFASASLLCLEALSLRRAALATNNAEERAATQRTAQALLARSHGEFNNLLARDTGALRPLVERYFLGTQGAATSAFEP